MRVSYVNGPLRGQHDDLPNLLPRVGLFAAPARRIVEGVLRIDDPNGPFHFIYQLVGTMGAEYQEGAPDGLYLAKCPSCRQPIAANPEGMLAIHPRADGSDCAETRGTLYWPDPTGLASVVSSGRS